MRQAPLFERMLVNDGSTGQLWFSVSRGEQHTRFLIRQIDPFAAGSSPHRPRLAHPLDEYTAAKEAMFFYTDTHESPWTVVKSNDKRGGASRPCATC